MFKGKGMCGISGYWDFKNQLEKHELNAMVHNMNNKIRYRGPDDEGIYLNNNLCMGMRRLSILDLDGGAQPIYNEDRTIAVVYNGEIYNFKRIRKELKKRGHSFYTETDTEIIVHAFEEYGVDAFDRFDGMYAIAIHDIKNDTLYLVRDRMGEKPLYYNVDHKRAIFGSELKCLTSTKEISKMISKRALNQYIQLSYIPAPLTIYEGTYKVLPGHYLKIDGNGTIEDCEYWDIPLKKTLNVSYSDAIKRLRKLLALSVKRRMVADVPLGAFLSGGVDSASVVGLMNRFGISSPKTFTIGSTEREYDERSRARKVAELNNTSHYEKIIGYDSFPHVMEKIMKYMDEPFADSSEIPTFLLSEFARENVTVVLTGDAGDELFAGYNKYLISYYGRKYKKIPKVIRQGLMNRIINLFPDSNSLTRKVKKVCVNTEKNELERHKALMHMGVKEEEIYEVFTDKYADNNSLNFINDLYNKYSSATELQRSLYTDLKVVLEGDMLVKVDRMSMINSLETRIPLLSKDIIEYAMKLPDEYKLKGRDRKRILKDAMKPILPLNFSKYPKSGFEVPVAKWMRDEMKTEVERVLDKERITKQGIFNVDYVEKIKREHFQGTQNRRDELWVLFVFEKWFEKEMDEVA